MTFCLNNESYDSARAASNITFGDMPNDCLHGGSEFTFKLYLDTTYDDWWSVRLRSVRYGAQNLKYSYTDTAIIDTGTSFFTISKTDFDNFASIMLELDGITCSYAEGCYSQDDQLCEAFTPQMEDLQIQLDFTVFNITPQYFTYNRLNSTSGKHFCQVTVSALPDEDGIYILGDPFLRAFTTNFDFGEQVIYVGINPNAVQFVSIYTVMTNWAKFGVGLGCMLFVLMLGTVVYFWVQHCKRQKRSRRLQIHSSEEHPYAWRSDNV